MKISKCKICGFPTFDKLCNACYERTLIEVRRVSKCKLLEEYRYGDKKEQEKCLVCNKTKTCERLCSSCSNVVYYEAKNLDDQQLIILYLKLIERDLKP